MIKMTATLAVLDCSQSLSNQLESPAHSVEVWHEEVAVDLQHRVAFISSASLTPTYGPDIAPRRITSLGLQSPNVDRNCSNSRFQPIRCRTVTGRLGFFIIQGQPSILPQGVAGEVEMALAEAMKSDVRIGT